MKNNFPIWFVYKILKGEKEKVDNMKNTDKNNHIVQTDAKFESKDKHHFFLLPHRGGKGLPLSKPLKINLEILLPNTV